MKSSPAMNRSRLSMAGSRKYAGIFAWSRSADPSIGEYGPPDEIFRWGDVPDME